METVTERCHSMTPCYNLNSLSFKKKSNSSNGSDGKTKRTVDAFFSTLLRVTSVVEGRLSLKAVTPLSIITCRVETLILFYIYDQKYVLAFGSDLCPKSLHHSIFRMVQTRVSCAMSNIKRQLNSGKHRGKMDVP